MAKAKRDPWAKFYWSDWSSDPKLKLCSLAAQGLWMRMLCIAAEADPVGHVLVEGKKLSAAELASIVGAPEKEIVKGLAELKKWGVYSVDRKGRIFSRKMVRSAEAAQISRENGAKGGNPNLLKTTTSRKRDNPKGNPQKLEAKARTPQAPQGAEFVWKGSQDILEALASAGGGMQHALSCLRYCDEEPGPPRRLVTRGGWVFDKLRALGETQLRNIGVALVEGVRA